jgi:hypothetical protein
MENVPSVPTFLSPRFCSHVFVPTFLFPRFCSHVLESKAPRAKPSRGAPKFGFNDRYMGHPPDISIWQKTGHLYFAFTGSLGVCCSGKQERMMNGRNKKPSRASLLLGSHRSGLGLVWASHRVEEADLKEAGLKEASANKWPKKWMCGKARWH